VSPDRGVTPHGTIGGDGRVQGRTVSESTRLAGLRRRAAALATFARLVWGRFWADDCFEAAAALSYTTLFALVPLSAVALGVIASFSEFAAWSERLTDFVFTNFVPAAARVVQSYLAQFAANAYQLTTIGVIALVVSALLLMSGIEETFNRIFRARARRSRVARFVVYWTVLTLGPVLVTASLGLSSYLFALPLIDEVDREWHFSERLLRWLPVVVTWVALWLAYTVIPATVVRLRHAAIGATVGTVLFELAKRGFAEYLARTSYEQVFGALAVIPIFILWMYLLWLIVLLGASIASAVGAFRFDHVRPGVGPGLEFAGLLRVLRRVALASRAGAPLSRAALARDEPSLTDEQIDRFLDQLRSVKLVGRSELGDLVLLREPDQVPLSELFFAGNHRFPRPDEVAWLKQGAGPDDEALLDWLDEVARAGDAALSRSVGSVLPARSPRTPETP
jgi:membrane protein